MSLESLSTTDTNPASTLVVENEQNSGVAETEVENTDSTEAHEDAEGDEENSSDLEAEADKPKKSGFEKRISKEVARKNEALREVEFWKKEALKSKGKDESQSSTQPSVTHTDKPKFSDYNDLEAYTEAITDWKVEQKLATQAEKSKQNTVVNTYNDRVKEFSKVRPDFQEVLASSELEISGPVKELIFESDVGPAIALHLAENEELAERIKGMSFVRQVAEIGKLEDKLTQKKVDKKVVSKAPAPISPIKGGAPVTTKSLDDPSISPDEWIKMRNKQKGFR